MSTISSFSIHNNSNPKKILTPTVVDSQSISTYTLGIPSITSIPLGNNKLYTINGTLYYKSQGGTVTVLATN